MQQPPAVRDILYLDFDKAASIWSQFEEGLLERVSVTADAEKDRSAGTKFGIPGVAEANLGVDYQEKRSTLYSKTLHHDVLNRVERALADAELVTDLSSAVSSEESSPQKIRAAIGNRPYLRAGGTSVLEDYRRMLAISEKFNEFMVFFTKLSEDRLKKSPEYKQLQELLLERKSALGEVADRNKRTAQKAELKELERKLETLPIQGVAKLDESLLNGIRLFINTFMRTRVNFRIYPFLCCPSFQVLCNLKPDCFVDADLEHLLYGYGNRPNVPLAVFGLITSLPHEDEPVFDPMKEFAMRVDLSGREEFEKGFRGLFDAIEKLESFMRYSRYPNVTVHPIAVYRSWIRGTQALLDRDR